MYIFIPYPYPTKQAFEAGTFQPHLIPDLTPVKCHFSHVWRQSPTLLYSTHYASRHKPIKTAISRHFHGIFLQSPTLPQEKRSESRKNSNLTAQNISKLKSDSIQH